MQFVSIGGGPIEASYEGLSSFSSEASSHSIAASYGPVKGGRRIIHALHVVANIGANPSVSGTPTIGGVSASVLKTTMNVPGGSLFTLGVIWVGGSNVPGTSGNLAISFSTTVAILASTWSTLNMRRLSPLVDEDQATWGSESSGSKVLGADVRRGGLLLAASLAQHDGSNPTLSGVGQDYTGSVTGSSPIKATGGHSEITADEAGKAITLTRTTGANWNGAFSAISLR